MANNHPLDANKVTASEICDLYKARWQVELNYRSIKTVLGMDFIAAQTNESVQKGIWAYMLTYNLIRIRMAQAAQLRGVLPIYLSFRAAQQIMQTARLVAIFSESWMDMDLCLLMLIAKSIVGNRPDRYEPRVIKRRAKSFKLMVEKRSVARGKLHKKTK